MTKYTHYSIANPNKRKAILFPNRAIVFDFDIIQPHLTYGVDELWMFRDLYKPYPNYYFDKLYGKIHPCQPA